jgi:KaiC/GvpD/RAD55 family RecA-like ATPase
MEYAGLPENSYFKIIPPTYLSNTPLASVTILVEEVLEYIKLGLPILDKLLPRGIPRDSLILIAGDSGTGKSLIAQLILLARIRAGERAVYVCLDDDPDDVVASLSTKYDDVTEEVRKGNLVLVDAYGARYGLEASELARERISNLDPHGFSSVLQRIADNYELKGKGLVVIDSLNPFIVKYEPTVVYDLLTMLRISLSKKRDITTIATLHTPTQLYAEIAANMEYMVDVMILLRYHTQALEAGYSVRELLVKKAKGVPVSHGWIKFMVSDEGIEEVEVRHVEGREK